MIAAIVSGNIWFLDFVHVFASAARFCIVRLIPYGGLYVRGFGQAFEISPDMKNSKHVTGL